MSIQLRFTTDYCTCDYIAALIMLTSYPDIQEYVNSSLFPTMNKTKLLLAAILKINHILK